MMDKYLVKNPPLATPADLEEFGLTLWAQTKVESGLPEESFTTRDRSMFMLGIAAALRAATK